MVYAMFIVFLFFLYIQSLTSVNTISNCTFSSNIYSSNSAVVNQFQFPNQTSVILTAEYAFISSSVNLSTFEIGLIYPFTSISDLVPFPIILNCSANVISCQLTTMAGTTSPQMRDSEPITVNLININYTSLNNQQSLYLIQGEYQLSNCLLDNGEYMTDNQTVFNIQIQYEKPVGTSCIPLIDTCGSSFLTTCSSASYTCTCLSSDSLVSFSNASFCADTLNRSNCSIFPTRCISWCNSTTNSLCQCPDGTLKILRNNFYVCELPVDSSNCSSNDSIRRCPYGQVCINNQCTNEIITSTTTSTDATQSIDSTEQNLRIALGVIAGLLGTSVLVLLGVFCWLRYRHRQRRKQAQNSFSPSSSATTSSLYISPIQQQDQQRKYPTTIYHLPVERSSLQRIPTIYRTDSFRQAVLSGHNRKNSIIEHISTRQDSLPYEKDDDDSQAYSTVEYNVSSQSYSNNPNIYQVIHRSSSPTILTHAV